MASLTLADMARRTVPGDNAMAKKPIAKVREDLKKAKMPKAEEKKPRNWYGKDK